MSLISMCKRLYKNAFNESGSKEEIKGRVDILFEGAIKGVAIGLMVISLFIGFVFLIGGDWNQFYSEAVNPFSILAISLPVLFLLIGKVLVFLRNEGDL